MPKHAWAMDQMYNGLFSNSDAPWQAGADLLANRALLAEELGSLSAPERQVNGLATSLRQSGVRAQNTREHGACAELYGQVLASCAGCHERTGGGPLVR